MVRKSYGKKRGTRQKLKAREKMTINRYLNGFEIGERVSVSLCPSSNFPHPRFQGKTGEVIEKVGKSYKVRLSDMGRTKHITIKPEHLKSCKGV